MNRTMKKEYLQPGTEMLDIELQPVLVTVSGEVKTDEHPDTSDDDNRSRQRTYNAWDAEEEEEDY